MITITRLEQEQMNIGLEGIIFTLREQDSILHMSLKKTKQNAKIRNSLLEILLRRRDIDD